MVTKKYEYDWELACTKCKAKYFKVRGRTGRILAKCHKCGKITNVKGLKIRHARRA